MVPGIPWDRRETPLFLGNYISLVKVHSHWVHSLKVNECSPANHCIPIVFTPGKLLDFFKVTFIARFSCGIFSNTATEFDNHLCGYMWAFSYNSLNCRYNSIPWSSFGAESITIVNIGRFLDGIRCHWIYILQRFGMLLDRELSLKKRRIHSKYSSRLLHFANERQRKRWYGRYSFSISIRRYISPMSQIRANGRS